MQQQGALVNADVELTAAIRSATGIPQVGAACRRVVQALGFPHFLYGMRVPVLIARPYQFVISGYPKAWRKRYDACGYMRIDPVLSYGTASVGPFSWEELKRSPPEVARMLEEAAGFGLRHGLSVPVHAPHGGFALLSLAREEPLPAESSERNRLFQRALWFTTQIHEQLRGLISGDGEFTVPEPKLSARERECLRLAAQGRSAIAIGREMNITERTVVYHLRHAMEKLGARSRQHAIALAVTLGELEPRDYPAQIEQSQKLFELPFL